MSEEKKIYRGEPIETKWVAENGHCVTLDNGYDLPYCEFGEENEEVVVTCAAYFHTFLNIVKDISKHYHVYGICMRQQEAEEEAGEEVAATEYGDDGKILWTRQWGVDTWNAIQILGLDKKPFYYVGKCHGVLPGWWIWRNHPEALKGMVSMNLVMHAVERDKNDWDRLQREDPNGFTLRSMRKKEGFALKAKEVAMLGVNMGRDNKGVDSRRANRLGTSTELICDSYDEVKERLTTNEIPILYLFSTDDILYEDFKSANEWAVFNTARSRSVYLQGEKHASNMDIPHRLAWECLSFFDWAQLPDA